MENILDFIMAALPWLAIGLLLTIFCARSAGRKNNENHKDNYGTEGMCLGMCFGSAIGTSFENHTGLCMTLGMLSGLVIGSFIRKKENKDE